MDLYTAIRGRRSVREYTNSALTEAEIGALIHAAVCAPSAVNEQPWAFTVVRDQALLDRVSKAAKAHLLATTAPGPHADHFMHLLSDPDFQIFYHAPALILISATAQGPWMVENCALAAENLMLAAHGAGLGSCWIGFAQGFLNTPEGKQLFDIPQGHMPVSPIIVGHPKAAPPVVARETPTVRWIG
jgi:nitroreductase